MMDTKRDFNGPLAALPEPEWLGALWPLIRSGLAGGLQAAGGCLHLLQFKFRLQHLASQAAHQQPESNGNATKDAS